MMTPVELLQKLLRIDTTNPPGNEGPAAELLESQLKSAGLETRIFKSPGGRPSLVSRVPGPTGRPALVLLSHTDVVGVEAERWTRDPFGGEIHGGEIYGRGAIDMKGVAVMHVMAATALAQSGADPAREVIVCVVADEEQGGGEGAGWLVDEHSDEVGFGDDRPPPEVLGEGGFGLTGVLARPVMPIVLGEKSAFWVKLEARGNAGHGSMPPRSQAPANLVAMIQDISGYSPPRIHPIMREQFATLARACSLRRGAAFKALTSRGGPLIARAFAAKLRSSRLLGPLLSDTVTLTRLFAGYKENVVPGEATAVLDCRLLPDADPGDFIARLEKRGAEYGIEVTAPGFRNGPASSPGPLYAVLEHVSRRLTPTPIVVPSLTPGGTDVRIFRRRGATGYGWVPLVLSPDLLATLHGHDERVPLADFHHAVQAMTQAVAQAATTFSTHDTTRESSVL